MVMKNLRKVGTVLRHRRSQRHDCLQSPRRELLILGSPLEVGCTWPVVQPGALVLLVLEGWVGLDTGGNTRVAANCSLRFDTYYYMAVNHFGEINNITGVFEWLKSCKTPTA